MCKRRQHQVAGQRGLDRDLGGFLVANLADQHDVRILAQDRRAGPLAKVRLIFGLTSICPMPGCVISIGILDR